MANVIEVPAWENMTLVGPRPETVALTRRYPAELQFIFRYRPGMTVPAQVLVRDEKVLGQADDVENFYLTEFVLHRVATDVGFLRNPAITQTIGWLIDTFLYLVRVVRPGPAAGCPPALIGAYPGRRDG